MTLIRQISSIDQIISATLASNEVTTLSRGPVKVVRDVP